MNGQISIAAARENGRETKIGEISTQLRLRTRIDHLAHLPIALCNGHANLIYANGADEAEDIALGLLKQLEFEGPSPRLLALSKLAKESVHPKYLLVECVLRGIGFHYANIPAQLRQEIESAFADGELKYLVCTSTLLQGVNLPAKNIFMLKPTRGQGKPLEPSDFWNLAGRAGRLRREFQGNIFLINYSTWPRKCLREPKDAVIAPAIESSIKISTEALLTRLIRQGAHERLASVV
jgi:replicative superfamily II helicase